MLSAVQFTALSDLLKNETAVVLEPGKEYLVESRLYSLMREEGFPTLGDLIDAVLCRSDAVLCQKVLLALTTNETSFFRDLSAFEYFKNVCMPELIQARAATKGLTIWSAACSTGQEPYSIAMSIRENFPALLEWNVRILGSDLNPNVVRRGEEGVYSSLEVTRGLSAQMLSTYFTQTGPEEFWISDDVKRMVSFFEQNLISTWPTKKVDVLFMRNVLIYFDTATKQQIFEKIKTVLAPDGFLFLGTAETPYRISSGFRKVLGGVNVYRLEVPEIGGK